MQGYLNNPTATAESLVEGVIEQLCQQTSAIVSEIDGVAENMEFALPKELRLKTVV